MTNPNVGSPCNPVSSSVRPQTPDHRLPKHHTGRTSSQSNVFNPHPENQESLSTFAKSPTADKRILGKAARKVTLCANEFGSKPPESATSRPLGVLFISEFQLSTFQLYQNFRPFLQQAHFPRSPDAHRISHDLHSKTQFLAARCLPDSCLRN